MPILMAEQEPNITPDEQVEEVVAALGGEPACLFCGRHRGVSQLCKYFEGWPSETDQYICADCIVDIRSGFRRP